MKIRELQKKDAPFMLEWMHDENVTEYLQANFKEKTLSDCEAFIEATKIDTNNKNWAICNDADEYLGTISLKNIDYKNSNAEYAISMRTIAQGTGASRFATERVLQIAFEEMELNRVYLNVLVDNVRADKFYNKMGFIYEGTFQKHLFVSGAFRDLKWYGITRDVYMKRKDIS